MFWEIDLLEVKRDLLVDLQSRGTIYPLERADLLIKLAIAERLEHLSVTVAALEESLHPNRR